MARPRKKTPEIEKAQGYPGRRKAKTAAEIAVVATDDAVAGDKPARAPRVPPAPEWLPEEARELWRALAGDLVRRQIIKTAGEWQEFERYISHCWMWRQLRAECVTPKGRLRTTYKTVTASGGERRLPNPAFPQMLQLDQKLKDYEDRFGLNPQARTALLMRIANVGSGKKPPLDPPRDGAEASPGGAPAKTAGSPLGILNTSKRLN